MKKLVNGPITNRIYWATVNEEKGTMRPDTRIDVTNNAIDTVFWHITQLETFKTGFAGYEFPKKDSEETTATLCVYTSDTHTLISNEEYNRLKKLEKEAIKLAEEVKRLSEMVENAEQQTQAPFMGR